MKKKGKIKTMFLLACMIMSFWSITVFADEYTARYDLSEGSVTIDADGIYYISQTGSDATANTITVNSDCTIYLDGVNILVPKPDSTSDYSRPNPFNINGAYNVKIHLVDGSVNTLASEEGYYDEVALNDTRLRCGSGRAALRVPEGAILTIYGDDGVLNAYGTQGHNKSNSFAHAGSGAGIGGDGAWANNDFSVADNSGKIEINGGVINAVGGESKSFWGAGGAGIGGGGGGYYSCANGGSSDSITINGGVVTAVSGSRRDKTPVKDENKDNTDGATQNQGNSDTTKTPETGDNNAVGLWIAFVLVSGLSVVASMVYTKRKNN